MGLGNVVILVGVVIRAPIGGLMLLSISQCNYVTHSIESNVLTPFSIFDGLHMFVLSECYNIWIVNLTSVEK